MTGEIIAIVTVGVALAGVGVALAGVISPSISRGACWGNLPSAHLVTPAPVS